MHEAIAQVAPDIARLPSDLKFPKSVPSGEPPWLVEARREDGVREVPGKGFDHSNRRIEAYHEAAGGREPDDVPWFVRKLLHGEGTERSGARPQSRLEDRSGLA
jgi:hypothetical protein